MTSSGFLAGVLLELRRFVWPVRNRVSSASLVTFGMMVFFVVYIYALDAVAGSLFHALGCYSQWGRVKGLRQLCAAVP